jgi:hypothetical protein
MAGRVADLAVQVHGGSGYMRDVPVERIYRDVRLLRLYEGTSEIQRLIIGGGLIRAQQRRRLRASGMARPEWRKIGDGTMAAGGRGTAAGGRGTAGMHREPGRPQRCPP